MHTCFVQKCQPFAISAGLFLFNSHATASDPKTTPKTATEATQTSIKQGVKS